MKHIFFIITLLTMHLALPMEKSFLVSVPAPNVQPVNNKSNGKIEIEDVFSIAERACDRGKESLHGIIQNKLLKHLVLMDNDQFLYFMTELQLVNGNTLLHEAAKRGDLKAVESLLRHYKVQQDFTSKNESPLPLMTDFVNCRNACMQTAFSTAVECNNFDVANYLLERGAQPNPYVFQSFSLYRDETTLYSLLMSLLKNGNIEGLRYLLDIDCTHDIFGTTIKTIYSTNRDDAKTATSLLGQGFTKFDRQQIDEGIFTYENMKFHTNEEIYFRQWHKTDLITFILKNIKHIDTAIADIASRIIRRLYDSSEEYDQALQRCLHYDAFATLKSIIYSEKRFTLNDSPHLLLILLKKQTPTLDAPLVEQGAPLQVVDDAGNSLLHWAMQLPHDAVAVSRRLIKHKAPINIKNEDNLTPFDTVKKNASVSYDQQPHDLQRALIRTGAKSGHALNFK